MQSVLQAAGFDREFTEYIARVENIVDSSCLLKCRRCFYGHSRQAAAAATTMELTVSDGGCK